ncbi:hypothetical protein ACFFTN_21110 [Aminobacter aganoensis]|uniref:Uncharacterized protein n=1 Tax=Aminobacter aganoensis TaxID=83264 RepID=A0A7X0FC47_9HYPH|nr:hypothetical protein [Aminobacter aganoensis]MBB6356930.1 hypothetical protein [Aminobacter aganoensis]
MKELAFYAIAAVATFATSALPAEQRHLACIAQWGASCGGGTDAFFNCGTPVQTVGEVICSIRTDRGMQHYAFTAKVIKDVPGGRCGLATVDVICHGLPDDATPVWHYDNCQAGRRAMCPRNYRFFGCEARPERIAQDYCSASNSPYQVFSYHTAGGGSCGKSLYSVACHIPR